MKANIRRLPGRSRNDQLRLRVTNMSAWLMMLTWRYTADETCSVLLQIDLTWKCFCRIINFKRWLRICILLSNLSRIYLEEGGGNNEPVEQDSDQC